MASPVSYVRAQIRSRQRTSSIVLALGEHPVAKSHRMAGRRIQPLIRGTFGPVRVALVEFEGAGRGSEGGRGERGERVGGGGRGREMERALVKGGLSVHGRFFLFFFYFLYIFF